MELVKFLSELRSDRLQVFKVQLSPDLSLLSGGIGYSDFKQS